MIDLPPTWALVADTPRLQLIPLTADDAGPIAALLAERGVDAPAGAAPPSEVAPSDRLRHWASRRSPDGAELWLHWVVRLVPLGDPIGHLEARVDGEGLAVIAWQIGTEWSGHGFATEAAGAMIRVLAAHVGVRRLVAPIDPGHEASQRVAARLGLERGDTDEAGVEVWVGICGEDRAPAPAPTPPRR